MIPASLRTPSRFRRVLTVGVVGAAMGLSLLLSACGTTSFDTYAPVLRIRPPEAPDRSNTAAKLQLPIRHDGATPA